MKRLILFLFAVLTVATAAVAADTSSDGLPGQVFTTTANAIMYKYPFVTSEVIDTLPAGAEVRIVAYDPTNKWARISDFGTSGISTDRFIDLKLVDFPGGKELTVTETFTGGDHNDDGVYRADGAGAWAVLIRIVIYILNGLILVFPIVYRVFRRNFEGRESAFALLTVSSAAVYLIFFFMYDMSTFYSTNFFFLLGNLLVYAVVLYCAFPLLVWSWLRIKPLTEFNFSGWRQAVLPLLFAATMIFIALKAAGLFIGLAIAVVAAIFIAGMVIRMVLGQVKGWGRRSGGGDGGVPGHCNSCRYYMDSSCGRTGTPIGPMNSCGGYSPN